GGKVPSAILALIRYADNPSASATDDVVRYPFRSSSLALGTWVSFEPWGTERCRPHDASGHPETLPYPPARRRFRVNLRLIRVSFADEPGGCGVSGNYRAGQINGPLA